MKTTSFLIAVCVFGVQNFCFAGIHYVDVTSTNAVPPYTNWSTAAAIIQDAIDVSVAGEEILVTNGVYQTGGRVVFGKMTNRVAVTKPLILRSVNGAGVTIIKGDSPPTTNGLRCVYLTTNSSLIGFTVLNGSTRTNGDAMAERSGGGIFCDSTNTLIDSCVIVSNSAAFTGGGVVRGRLVNCTLTKNSTTPYSGYTGAAEGCEIYLSLIVDNMGHPGGVYKSIVYSSQIVSNYGGGAGASTLNDCVLIGNTALGYGGGGSACIFTNCTLFGNVAYYDGGGAAFSELHSSILSSNAAGGAGGARDCFLDNCLLVGNRAVGNYGGGALLGTLISCTLIGNSANYYGGGAHQATLTNCMLIGNSGRYGGGASSSTLNNCYFIENYGSIFGGGAYSSSLNNCVLSKNSSDLGGGGADASTLTNCTVVYNKTVDPASISGGGVRDCILRNSILYFNTRLGDTNQPEGGVCYYCCVTPLTRGVGNFESPPLLVSEDDLHLQTNSPCINAGKNLYVSTSADLDGNPRITGVTVDVGAYEFQAPTSPISYQWLQQYSFLTDGSMDYLDVDGDGFNNWQEWRWGTDPTNAFSLPHLLNPVRLGTNVMVTWESSSNRTYTLEQATNFPPQNYFLLASNLTGKKNTLSYTNQNVFGRGLFFYRVRVEE